MRDKDLREIGVSQIGDYLIGVGEDVAGGDPAADAHVVEFLLCGPEAGFDISEAFVIRELGRNQKEKLVSAQDLRQNRTTGIHQPSPSARVQKCARLGTHRSHTLRLLSAYDPQ